MAPTKEMMLFLKTTARLYKSAPAMMVFGMANAKIPWICPLQIIGP
mgnify:CR=1 FL=1